MLPLRGRGLGRRSSSLLLRFGVLAAITAVLTANLLLVPAAALRARELDRLGHVRGAPAALGLAVLAFRSAVGGHSGLRRYLAGDAPTSRPACSARALDAATALFPRRRRMLV